MSEMGQASAPIRAVKPHAPTLSDIQRTGNDMHRQATARNATDYESAALPLSYWPYTAGKNVVGGSVKSDATGQKWVTPAPVAAR